MAESPSEVHPDLFLVEAALRGEPNAIEQLAHRLRCVPRVLGAWNARMGRPLSEHDVADLVQDVTVIVLEKLDRFAGRAPFEAWVYKICRLELMNSVRRKTRPRATTGVELEELPSATSVEAELFDFERLHAALDRLGGVEAEAIRSKHFGELTFEEIGRQLKISPNTAKTRYYRGMLRLESWLRDDRADLESGREP